MVGNTEIANVNVAGALAGRDPVVVSDLNCAMFVLIYYVIVDLVPLSLQEFSIPDNLRQGVTDTHYFRFIGSFGIYLS